MKPAAWSEKNIYYSILRGKFTAANVQQLFQFKRFNRILVLKRIVDDDQLLQAVIIVEIITVSSKVSSLKKRGE